MRLTGIFLLPVSGLARWSLLLRLDVNEHWMLLSCSSSSLVGTDSEVFPKNSAAVTVTLQQLIRHPPLLPAQVPPHHPHKGEWQRPQCDFKAGPVISSEVNADAGSFKQVVQMLTGCADTVAKHAAPTTKNAISPSARATGPKKPAFKLYERRGSLKNLKMISPLIPAFVGSNPNSPMGTAAFSQRRQPEILSPSMLDLPSLTLSPVTPLIPDPFNRSPQLNSAAATAPMSAEDRAIAERGFYLHPSPRSTPRDAEPPRLLPLFPVTSPRVPSASAAGSSS
ncbi:hypothetical protein B296_00057458 [Ensete ventricosum]|uniref:VQ domain-containing protein n=1 Tax=Ensete ventricosum TaxID=4639 RepID=A0A426XR25_ENSVE|nr:hypothetical protein B296_00057458 [Ensete ventricosum]